MAFIHMVRPKPSKAKLRKMNKAAMVEEEWYERYPYGLRLDLGKEELDKLNIDVDDYDTMDTINLNIKAKVVRVSKSKDINMRQEKTERQNLDLQVTHIDMGENKDKTIRQAVKAMLK